MKVNIRASGYKFDDLFKELDRLRGNLGEAALAGAKEIGKVAEQSMRQQYGKSGDFIADSIGHNVEMGEDGKSAVGSVGVFKVDHVAARHLKMREFLTEDSLGAGSGVMKKAISAPQIAWWIEYGTIRQPARPFIESGWLMSLNQQDKAFKDAFNKIIDEARNGK